MENVTAKGNKRIFTEKNYKHAFNNLPQPVWIFELTTYKFLEVNQCAIDTYGYSREEFLNMTVMDIRPKEDADLLEEIIAGSKSKPLHTAGWKHILKNGSEIFAEIYANEIVFNNKKARLVLVKDITLEKTFDDSQHLASAIVNSSEDAIISKTLDGLITSWNEGAERMYGYSKDEIINRPVSILFPPENPNEFDVIMEKIRNGERIDHFQTIRVKKDNSIIFVSISISPIKDRHERIVGASTIARDITRIKLIEQERDKLLRTEIELRKRTEKVQERLVFLSEASKILSSSIDYETTLASIAGISVPFICDWCAIDLINENNKLKRVAVIHSDGNYANHLPDKNEEVPSEAKDIYDVIKSGKSKYFPVISTELLRDKAIDREISSLINQAALSSLIIVPLKSHDKIFGTITMVMKESHRNYDEEDLSFIEEIANRAALAIENVLLYQDSQMINAELEERVKVRTEQLENANNELETFSYSVSHDLKAPLRAIEGFSKLLLEEHSDKLDEEARRLFNIVISNTARMSQLIEDLLEFSRVTRTQMNKIKIDMTKLVGNAFNDLKNLEADRNIDFMLNDLSTAEGDPSMLRQVWINLIANAIKFTRPRTQAVIQIGNQDENGDKIYFIKDNGVGFDMRYAEKLFGVFQRLHKYKDFEGTGVGLALVERIIKRHGGRIWAESKINEGTSFYFTLSGKGD